MVSDEPPLVDCKTLEDVDVDVDVDVDAIKRGGKVSIEEVRGGNNAVQLSVVAIMRSSSSLFKKF